MDVRRGLGVGRTPGWAITAAAGGAWGLLGYAVLWGHTPLVLHRPFVLSPLGTVLLLPVRLVLGGIHFAETRAAATFDFSSNNGWIGLVAAVVGALIALGGYWLVRLALRLRRGRG